MGNLAPLVPQKLNANNKAPRFARRLKKRHHMGNLAPLVPQKHRRDGMSRLGTSRNVQWSAEGARKCVYPRFQNLVNLSSLRSRRFR